ncbi:MAG: hypothetical protein COA32_10210 [Fluviicola sp.]|nr:MAG: hypothetical protein COA32_10210 [Fluviicola sp.]
MIKEHQNALIHKINQILKWLTNIFNRKKRFDFHKPESKIDYIKITTDWNADPVSPEIQLKVVVDDLVVEMLVNHFQFDEFIEGDKVKITFKNCSIYSLNTCNDKGYFFGQYRINPNELPWGEFYEIRSGLDKSLPDPVVQLNNKQNVNRHYIFFFKDETFECLATNYKLEFFDKNGLQKNLNYSYKLRPAYNSKEQLIEFVKIGNADSFMKKLISVLGKNGFSLDDISDVWMNDEIWIHLKSSSGKITITKDIWDMIFILGEKNQEDINRINQILIDSGQFEKIEINPEEYNI